MSCDPLPGGDSTRRPKHCKSVTPFARPAPGSGPTDHDGATSGRGRRSDGHLLAVTGAPAARRAILQKRETRMISFKGAHFPKDIILMGVRWYVAYPLSYRHVEE